MEEEEIKKIMRKKGIPEDLNIEIQEAVKQFEERIEKKKKL